MSILLKIYLVFKLELIMSHAMKIYFMICILSLYTVSYFHTFFISFIFNIFLQSLLFHILYFYIQKEGQWTQLNIFYILVVAMRGKQSCDPTHALMFQEERQRTKGDKGDGDTESSCGSISDMPIASIRDAELSIEPVEETPMDQGVRSHFLSAFHLLRDVCHIF